MSDTQKAQVYDIAILGAGYSGLMAALRLRRYKRRLRIALVNADDRFVERVRLQESVATEVAPRISSISAFVAVTGIEFICANVISLDPVARRVRLAVKSGERDITFSEAIYALGSGVAVDDVPGVDTHAYRLDPGRGPRSAAALRLRLEKQAGQPIRVVVVGGAETGIEAAGEIKTAWPRADVTVITRSRCGDFKGPRVEKALRAELQRLGITAVDGQVVAEVRPNEILTETGQSFACDVCVWSGGLRSSAIAHDAGLATDPRGRVWVDPVLRSVSHPRVLAVGDAAHPIAPTGAPYRLSAFVALASGAHAADVVLARLAQRKPRPFCFSTFGQGVSIGRAGVGFPTYPNDEQTLFILRGRTAYHTRNFFVWFVSYALKLERRFPGLFFWPGRRRVSWQQANQAMQQTRTA
jgi:NADH dehydrogenase FAD-containing subunit